MRFKLLVRLIRDNAVNNNHRKKVLLSFKKFQISDYVFVQSYKMNFAGNFFANSTFIFRRVVI